jgi:hypothetical protein
MEKLSIKNFAGLKDVTIDVKPITGFIGPQASGKSVIAKLLYFFREIASRLPEAALAGRDVARYKAECERRFGEYFHFGGESMAFAIEHSWDDAQARIVRGNRGVKLEWSDFYPRSIEEINEEKRGIISSVLQADADAMSTALRGVLKRYHAQSAEESLGSSYKQQQIFVPAGRAFFSQFESSIFAQLRSGVALDPFIIAFGERLGLVKVALEQLHFFNAEKPLLSQLEEIRPAFKRILKADAVRVEDEDFLKFEDGRRVPVARSSSGLQEVWPLLLMMADPIGSGLGRAVYIEEPEAHLFPSTQKDIVEVIAHSFRKSKGEMSVVITTHSPYILTSINNLLQAGQLYVEAGREEAERLSHVIPESAAIMPGELAFYALQDGGATSIMDEETGLINANIIDSVSDVIAVQFEQLLAEADEKP